MALFFQFDIPSDLEPFGGDHLLVFHCRAHNDASCPEVVDGRLEPRCWDAPQPGLPGPVLAGADPEPRGAAGSRSRTAHPRVPLTLRSFEDTPAGAQTFKVGGAPSWAQRPEFCTCACSADLVYVCQVPENMDFAVHPGQP
ncbi:hypothetical protein ACE6JH_33290 [Streptomyces nigra]